MPPDCDQQMDGPALSEQVKALRPDIGMLFMSGYAPDQAAHRHFGGEGLHHVQKPFEISALAAAVHGAIKARFATPGRR
mgnify:FL=1